MMLPEIKADLSFKHSAQPDDLRLTLGSAMAVKVALDSQAMELLTMVNAIIAALTSTTNGDSGADAVQLTPVPGLSGTSVQSHIASLKQAIDGVTLGSVPDKSITVAKLSDDAVTVLNTIIDPVTNKHYVWVMQDGSIGLKEVL